MKVVISRKIPASGIQLLKGNFDLIYLENTEKMLRDKLLDLTRDADALLCLLNDPIDAEFIQECPKLKVIANYAVGYNNIDLEAAKKAGIIVTNTPDVLTNATADLAIGLLLAVSRNIVQAHNFTLENKFMGWDPMLMLGPDLEGKTLGVIGPGRIGSAVIHRASAFGLKIIYHSRNPKPELESEYQASQVTVDDLVTRSDFIVLTAPLTPETHHIINKDRLSKMKSSAILINVGRGPLIDEDALVNALQNGQLGGAGLDVYEEEPKIHPDLFNLSNVVLLPHIGSAGLETREKMSMMAANNIIAVLGGNSAPNAVRF